jgi:hypothetical protein
MKTTGIDRTPMNDPLVRLSLAAQLAFAVGLLHKHGIVYGDLSLKNVAVAANPPRLLLLDCDAAALETDGNRKQMHTYGFEPPEKANGSQPLQDRVTDVYKLGLCILRSLVTGQGVTQLRNARVLAQHHTLDPAGVDLVVRAVSDVRADRPTAKDLCLHLEQTVLARAHPPALHRAALDRGALPRGTDVVVTWAADGATSARILGPNGMDIPIADPDGHPRGYSVTPAGSGDILVQATNRYGTETLTAGHVTLYDLPAVEPPQLPRPQVPPLPAVRVPAVLSALPPRPAVTTGTHPVPRLAAPDLSRLLDAIGGITPGDAFLAPGRRTTARLRDAQREASAEIAGLISETLTSALAAVRRATSTTTKAGRP